MKRILSITLCVLLIACAMIPAYSAQVYSDITSTGTNVISFDVTTSGWNNFKTVYCHVWACDGTGDWPSWGSKAEKCNYDESTGIATYDLSKTKNTIGSGANWCCVFSNENGMQTFDLLFGSECFGDIACCDWTTCENPADSSKVCQLAFWKGQDKNKFGPRLAVTSIGNVVGTCCPGNTNKKELMNSFLLNYLENARYYSGKDDQSLIDDIGTALGLSVSDVRKAISDAGVVVDWSRERSQIYDDSNPEFTDFHLFLDLNSFDSISAFTKIEAETYVPYYYERRDIGIGGGSSAPGYLELDDYDSSYGTFVENGVLRFDFEDIVLDDSTVQFTIYFSNYDTAYTNEILLSADILGKIGRFKSKHNNTYSLEFVNYTEPEIEQLDYDRDSFVVDNIRYGITNKGNVFVTDCLDKSYSDKTISIPSTVKGYKVTGVDRYAFLDCECKEIVLPNTIEYLGYRSLQTSMVRKVYVPSSVKIIDTAIDFDYYYHSLTYVVDSNSLFEQYVKYLRLPYVVKENLVDKGQIIIDAKSFGYEKVGLIDYEISEYQPWTYSHGVHWGESSGSVWSTTKNTPKDIWTFNIEDREQVLDSSKIYVISIEGSGIISDSVKPIAFTTNCLGHTLKAKNKDAYNMEAYFEGINENEAGSILDIDKRGNITGTYIPKTTNAKMMFAHYLYKREVAGIVETNDQKLFDSIGAKLGLTKQDIMEAIEGECAKTNWDASKSTLPNAEGVPEILGDANMSGNFDLQDAVCIQKFMAELIPESKIDLLAADVNKNGIVDVMDATRIQKFLAYLIPEL